jgi:hypothetical protein
MLISPSRRSHLFNTILSYLALSGAYDYFFYVRDLKDRLRNGGLLVTKEEIRLPSLVLGLWASYLIEISGVPWLWTTSLLLLGWIIVHQIRLVSGSISGKFHKPDHK